MNVVTWNVQGLKSRLYQQNRWKLRRDLEEYILGGFADIIMLQEHHLISTRLNLQDIWHSHDFQQKRDSLLFSWLGGRNNGPTLSRINHIYVGEALEAKGG